MSELSSKNIRCDKRVIFPKRKQKDFLEEAQNILGLNGKELAELAKVSVRSLNDWKREKFSMSLSALKRICQRAGIPLPKNIKIKDPFWYVYIGGRIGGLVVFKKYGKIGGNPEYRKKKWQEWWEKKGKFEKHPIINVCAPIKIPRKSSRLAEFVGILLGDGSLARRQMVITLNRLEDRCFVPFLRNLIQKLFTMNPSISERKEEGTISVIASRTRLIRFFTDMGLSIGSKVKHQVDVPLWIKKSLKFTKSCVRGLFDTDGCIYVYKHRYKDRTYYNIAINFTNRSIPILRFFKRGLERCGFHPTQKTKFSIFLRREEEIVDYFQKVGSSHPKYLNKFENYFKNKYGEVPKWI